MHIKFHILIFIVFLCQWPPQMDAVLGMFGQRAGIELGRMAAKGGISSIIAKVGRAPAQIVRNGGLQQMPKPQGGNSHH
jgi:hypothetical protein